MKKRAMLAGGIAMGLTAAAAAAIYTEAMFSLFSKRKSRLYNRMFRRKQTGRKPSEAMGLAEEKRAALHNLDLETVALKSADGLTLLGRWYQAENPRRTLICFHGWRGSWDQDFGPVANFLHNCGCNLLFVEQRSHGGSEGKYISYGILERYDAQAWFDYVNQRNVSELPVYLYGVSMGAATVLMASTLPLKDTVMGIIADCGFTSANAIIQSTLSKKTSLPMRRTLRAADSLFRRRTGYGYEEYSALAAMAENTVPTLFIHGDADGFVPVTMTYENYAACRAPKELLIVRGAGHAMSAVTDPEAYERALLEFFAKY